MTVSNFHEAALVLQGACQAIDRLLEETEPMERAYHQETVALGLAGELGTEAGDERSDSSGYAAFYSAVMRLSEYQHQVDGLYFEEAHRNIDVA